jgi:hypothetical protein
MKVFGVGLNKTGTTTLGQCFKLLGYRHAPYDRTLLYRLHEGDPEPAFAVADKFETFEDWPWPLMFKQLDARYPDAKFVLTERSSPQKWIDSLKNHSERSGTERVREIAYGHPMPRGHEDELMAFYAAHGRAVREHFVDRPEKLLVSCWETESRWHELCAFVGKDVPETPFPHANQRPDGS